MKYLIETWGCQMNSHDSEKLEWLLTNDGHEVANKFEDANLILLNTCSIREKAVHKIYTRLGRLREEKKKRSMLIGVLGCWAQQEKDTLFKIAPQVDFVIGTMAIQKLPSIIKSVMDGNKQVIDVNSYVDSHLFPSEVMQRSHNTAKAMITITEGCDHACTYCIVPKTRGPERHRPFQSIIQEARNLVDQGFKEIELLGQNVNSFQGGCTFSDLLNRVSEIEDLEWIRFTTSHPVDFTPTLAQTIINNKKVAPFLHLPVQSGSDTILRRMGRGYTTAKYLECLSYLSNKPNDLCLSTDFIVGFPGESDVDFQATMNLLNHVQFDLSFSFIYSPRPGTAATRFNDDLPHSVKLERLNQLQARQTELTINSNRKAVGQTVKVRIETNSTIGNGYWLARTANWKNVHIYAANDQKLPFGSLVEVQIIDAGPHFLVAKLT